MAICRTTNIPVDLITMKKSCQNKGCILVPYETVCPKVSVSSAKRNILFDGAMTAKVTVNFLNIRTPKTFVVITLKFELCGSTIE